MYQALYRKWRPATFDEMCGQTHITDILKRQCDTDKISHAYLFCGTRGTGKTSAAKILAKAANCLSPINGNPCGECDNCKAIMAGNATDVLEIDAASNNGVDNIRDLRDEVLYPPAYLKKRVYIIDEVHMLSAGAFNALLKTLEEPPEYVIFILATTELHKIPPTILSRCQRFEFRNISSEEIKNRLLYVADEEKIPLSENAAKLIANLADGAMRDALSLLESCVSANTESEITEESVVKLLGITGNETGLLLFEALRDGNIASALEIVERVNASAIDIVTFLEDLSYLLRDMVVAKLGNYGSLNERFVYSSDSESRMKALADSFSSETLFRYADILDSAQSKISRHSLNKRLMAEMAIIKLCTPATATSGNVDTHIFEERFDKLEARIVALENGSASVKTKADARVAPSKPPVTEAQKEEAEKKTNPITANIPFSDLLDFLND